MTDQPLAHVCILDLGHDATNFSELSRQRSDFVGNFLVVLHHRVFLLVPCTFFSTLTLLWLSLGLRLRDILIGGCPLTRRRKRITLLRITGLREGPCKSFVGKQPLPGQRYGKVEKSQMRAYEIQCGRWSKGGGLPTDTEEDCNTIIEKVHHITSFRYLFSA